MFIIAAIVDLFWKIVYGIQDHYEYKKYSFRYLGIKGLFRKMNGSNTIHKYDYEWWNKDLEGQHVMQRMPLEYVEQYVFEKAAYAQSVTSFTYVWNRWKEIKDELTIHPDTKQFINMILGYMYSLDTNPKLSFIWMNKYHEFNLEVPEDCLNWEFMRCLYRDITWRGRNKELVPIGIGGGDVIPSAIHF